MVVEDNKIIGAFGGGIRMQNVSGGSIKNNLIDLTVTSKFATNISSEQAGIMVSTCKNINVENNTIILGQVYKNDIILSGNYEASTVILKNNLIIRPSSSTPTPKPTLLPP